MPALLAHQGGWDEMLMVAVPIIAIVMLLRVARRRAGRAEPDEGAAEEPATADQAEAPTDQP